MTEPQEPCDPVYIKVPIGERAQDFQTGNFLTAVDFVNCYFQEKCAGFTDVEAAAALRFYADKIEGRFE